MAISVDSASLNHSVLTGGLNILAANGLRVSSCGPFLLEPAMSGSRLIFNNLRRFYKLDVTKEESKKKSH